MKYTVNSLCGMRCAGYMNPPVSEEKLTATQYQTILYFLCGNLPRHYSGLMGERFWIHVL
jgi:hypothetical protein